MNYNLTRESRKTVSIRIMDDLTIEVKAPRNLPKSEIDAIVASKQKWLEKHIQNRSKVLAEAKADPLSMSDIQALADQAVKYIPGRVAYYAKLMGVTYGRITIRNQRTRWGSCTSTGNLNFNCLLMLTPPEVIDSVVVHELCHRRHMDHSKEFYADIYKVFPEYDSCHGWLKKNGAVIMERMKSK